MSGFEDHDYSAAIRAGACVDQRQASAKAALGEASLKKETTLGQVHDQQQHMGGMLKELEDRLGALTNMLGTRNAYNEPSPVTASGQQVEPESRGIIDSMVSQNRDNHRSLFCAIETVNYVLNRIPV